MQELSKYRSIFISDVHLGSKDSKADLLDDFLKHTECDNLYLVGDIIDGWKIQRNAWRWKESHTRVLRRILKKSQHGCAVTYIAGNHDEFLRLLIPTHAEFGKIKIVNQATHVGADGLRYLVVHGDLFDGITRIAPWLSHLGDWAYEFALSLNSKFNWCLRKFGFGYWSLSGYLKQRVKKAIDFVFQFEGNLAEYCKKRKFDGVVCGHIHQPAIKDIAGVKYMNTGDFVENCSALVEYFDGTWDLIYWTKKYENNTSGDR